MSKGGKTQNSINDADRSPSRGNAVVYARNLSKFHLGSVIFGCKNSTINECLSKQLFGLPPQHYSYVKNIDPGLALFLFNYSDRKLHGIFEAASSGQMNINPYGWTVDGSERTLYPAQVQIRVRTLCQPLLESQFKPIIAHNYYSYNHFWFELDHAQTNKLISLLASRAGASSIPQFTTRKRTVYPSLPSQRIGDENEKIKPHNLEVEHSDLSSLISDPVDVPLPLEVENRTSEACNDPNVADEEEKHQILLKLQRLAVNSESPDLPSTSNAEGTTLNKDVNLENCCHSDEPTHERKEKFFGSLTDYQSLMAKMAQEIQELKDTKAEQAQKIVCLETRLLEAQKEIQDLNSRMMFDAVSNASVVEADRKLLESFVNLPLDPDESIFLIGGYDGESWLSTLDLYDPGRDVIKSLRPMGFVRSYASVARLNGEIYVIGGGDGQGWYNTVESYSPENDQWTLCPSLIMKKGSLGGVAINGKLFAIGGGNGFECFSDVEMLDLNLGRWVCTRSMLQKRFALAAVELNGALYATGGYDGSDYLNSAERFDIREHSWTEIPSMNAKRGSHSLVILNEKLYAIGGFDGRCMVSSMEVYDPRMESWIDGEPMKQSRGYATAGVINDSIYVIGGVKFGHAILDTVEVYKEGHGWQENGSRVLRKRCFHSAIV